MSSSVLISPANPIATIRVRLFDGARQPFLACPQVLLYVHNAQAQEVFAGFVQPKNGLIDINLTFHANFMDTYSVTITCHGFKDVGFTPVHASLGTPTIIDLMMVKSDSDFTFTNWETISSHYPYIADLLSRSYTVQQAQAKYEGLATTSKPALACILNLATAMKSIQLPEGTPLDYFRQLIWDDSQHPVQQDRFFVWALPSLVDEVRRAAKDKLFAAEPLPGAFHGDATCSFKQTQFGEANVQLTFHEKSHLNVNNEDCIIVEPDIDYYKDLGAHALTEVLVNNITHSLTDPRQVYVLRWMAGQHAGLAQFDPPYTLT